MRKRILVFGASNSKQSINKKLAIYAASQLSNVEVNLIDLNDFEMPIYSIDREVEDGIPEKAHNFKNTIDKADGIIISFAEHNGAYSAAYKNVFDWVSRIEKKVWQDKPLFLLSTSPGPQGGSRVMKMAFDTYSYGHNNSILKFSLPSFEENFNAKNGIVKDDLQQEFNQQLKAFEASLI